MSTGIYTLEREQWVPRPIDKVFAYFADAHNLEELTPPWLRFKILSISSDQIQPGTEIRYRLSLHGIPIHWLTEIQVWDPPHEFVDIQRSGPYRLWHHTHLFQSVDGGTKISDIVRYQLPFGFLGRIVRTLKVRNDVEQIFEFRRARIQQRFGNSAA